jgi:cell division septation protein DedD
METALKQRLVGAMVLVALAVIFLPMLIKGPAPESGVADVSLDPPQMPRDGFETRELPLVSPSADAGAGALPAVTAPGRPSAVEAGAPADDATMLPPPTAGGDYAVSFGSYASQDDAARVVAALAASQLPGYHEPVPASGGRILHRVRIGPFATRADAEAARLRAARVRDDVGSKVVVLDAEAAPASLQVAAAAASGAGSTAPASAPVTAEAAPSGGTTAARSAEVKKPAPPAAESEAPRTGAAGVGFAVQLGAFGNANEAAKLRDRARAAGFSAFVEQVQTEKGTLNRVRIGPVADRAEADRLRERAAAQLGVSGLVRPHP